MCVGQHIMIGIRADLGEGCSVREMVEGEFHEGEREQDLCVLASR